MSTATADVNDDDTTPRFDVAVLGGGSAAEALVSELRSTESSVVVFEPARVGGECPFVACMPTKAMLHDAVVRRSWSDAVKRRFEVAEHLDDAEHARQITDDGAVLVRFAARLVGTGEIEANGKRYRADHVVLATGSEVAMPQIPGLGSLGHALWTSADAMTAQERPARLTIVGGGVIGSELATIFARFGTEVHLLDSEPTAFPDLPGEIGRLLDDALSAEQVRIRRDVTIERVESRGGGVRTIFDNGAWLDTDRLLVATGTKPRTAHIGLDGVGLSGDEPLPVGSNGRIDGLPWLWAIGDVAGMGEYTHLANHQARIVAAAIGGDEAARFDDVVTPACVFTDPPILTMGAKPTDERGKSAFWVSARMSELPRTITDELGDGFLTIGVDREGRHVVGAHGIGAGFDQLAAALVTAIDGAVPVERLAQSMWPFPSVGEILGLVYSRAASESSGD